MRWFVAILGLPMVLGLTAVSVVMNFRFGLLLGRSHLDGLIYAAASACADILKCLIPIVLGWSWANRRLFITFAAGLLFLIFTAYSVTSSLGYAAINRAERSGQRAAEISRHRDLRAELDHKLAQRTICRPSGLRRRSTPNCWRPANMRVGPPHAVAPTRRWRKAALSVTAIFG